MASWAQTEKDILHIVADGWEAEGSRLGSYPRRRLVRWLLVKHLLCSPEVLTLDPEPIGELSLVHSFHLSSGEVGGRDSAYLKVSWPTSLAYLVKV